MQRRLWEILAYQTQTKDKKVRNSRWTARRAYLQTGRTNRRNEIWAVRTINQNAKYEDRVIGTWYINPKKDGDGLYNVNIGCFIISYYYYSSNSNKRNSGHSEKMDKNKCPFFLFGMENLFF